MNKFLCNLILVALVSAAVCRADQVSWVNNVNQYSFFAPSNWNLNRAPTLADDVTISENNSYVYVNSSSGINSLYFDSANNGTMVINGNGTISTNVAVITNNATLYIDSSLKSAPAFQSNQSTTVTSKIVLKSGTIDVPNLYMQKAQVSMNSGTQNINSNFITFDQTNIQQTSSKSNVQSAARFTGSSLQSIGSTFNSMNQGVISTIHASNLTFTSSSFQTDNYFVFETSAIKLISSAMSFSTLNMIDGSIFNAESSSVSFDKIFHTQSSNTVTMKKFSTIQSTAGSSFVANYRSSIYLENIILMMKGDIVLRDRAVLSFGGLVLPLTPIKVKVLDKAQIKYKGLLSGLFNLQKLTAEQPSEEASQAVGDRELSSITFELNGDSNFEADQDLNNVNIIAGENSSVKISNLVLSNSSISSSNGIVVDSNVVLNGSTIASDITNTGSISGSGVISGNLENQGTLGSFDTVSKIVVDGSVNSSPNSKIAILINSNTEYTQIQVGDSITLADGVIQIKIGAGALLDNQEFELISYGNNQQPQVSNIVVEFANSQTANYTIVSGESSLKLKINSQSQPVTKTPLFISLISVGAALLAITAIVAAVVIRNKRAKSQVAQKGVELQDGNQSIDISE